MSARTIRFERSDLCWPLLFHAEPMVTSIRWMSGLSVVVTDHGVKQEYADVAQARAAAADDPPDRVEMFAVYRGDTSFRVGLWVVGFGPNEQPAVTVHADDGLGAEARDLQASVIEFLVDEDPAVQAPVIEPADDKRGRWYWLTDQPLGVTIVGGVVAALLAAGIVALLALLF